MNWKYVFVFFIGFFSCAFLFLGFGNSLEFPLTISGFSVRDVASNSMTLLGSDKGVLSAPSDYVNEEDIVILGDKVILKIENATLSSYMDSGSMAPVLDKGANGIRVVPSVEDDVEVGDIVSFRMNGFLVVHRVVGKGFDEDGVWFDVKGDANLVGDGRIRFEDIEYKTVGVIY